MHRAHNSPVLHPAIQATSVAQVPTGIRANQYENTNWDLLASNPRQLDEIASFWRALETDITSPIRQYLWSESCSATVPLDGKLHFVVVKTGSRTGAIAPLVRAEGPLGRLEHLGVSVLREPTDLVFSDLAALKSLADALVKLGSPLFLGRIP